MMIQRRQFDIHGWNPGATDDSKVSIVEVLYGGGATLPFLSGIRLEDARFILACINHCLREKAELLSIKLDR